LLVAVSQKAVAHVLDVGLHASPMAVVPFSGPQDAKRSEL
jgi:hypothetical protein